MVNRNGTNERAGLCRRVHVAAVLLIGASALAQAQTAAPTNSAPRAPGVSRAIEHPDSPDQTPPDAGQPETAVDHDRLKPETAKDDQKLQPETAADTPAKSSSAQRAADIAKQGVRSNTPPPAKPAKPQG